MQNLMSSRPKSQQGLFSYFSLHRLSGSLVSKTISRIGSFIWGTLVFPFSLADFFCLACSPGILFSSILFYSLLFSSILFYSLFFYFLLFSFIFFDFLALSLTPIKSLGSTMEFEKGRANIFIFFTAQVVFPSPSGFGIKDKISY